MPILNYTTQVAAAKIVGEIQALLVKHGTQSVRIDYQQQTPVALGGVWLKVISIFIVLAECAPATAFPDYVCSA